MYDEICSLKEREDKLTRKVAQYKAELKASIQKSSSKRVKELAKGAYDSRRRIQPELRKVSLSKDDCKKL